MSIDPALLSSMSALLGALAGGGASLAAAVYTQRYQDRLQRMAREIHKRETVYADFIMAASSAVINAYFEDGLTIDREKQQLFGMLQRIKLFAPASVVLEADQVVRTLVEIALQPKLEMSDAVKLAQSNQPDFLASFSQVSRADLDSLDQRFH